MIIHRISVGSGEWGVGSGEWGVGSGEWGEEERGAGGFLAGEKRKGGRGLSSRGEEERLLSNPKFKVISYSPLHPAPRTPASLLPLAPCTPPPCLFTPPCTLHPAPLPLYSPLHPAPRPCLFSPALLPLPSPYLLSSK
ncbi:Ferredoxin--nitrite reductase [Nodularia spumigena CCY9414]|nr:Ferredoxin--nitrite reductase [Nodularia spumigena CCY9414]